jgi:hypothetical protein
MRANQAPQFIVQATAVTVTSTWKPTSMTSSTPAITGGG